MTKFLISQDFGTRHDLLRFGAMLKAEWRLLPGTENEFRAKRLLLHAPVQGYMVVDTGFAGIAIDGDVAKELNLPAVGRTSVQGVEGNILQSSYRALLLMSVGEIDGEKLAIGVPVKAVCLPKIRASYDAYGLATQEGTR